MKRALLSLAGLALSALALGQLAKYKDWPKSPEAYFLTSAERQEWSKVATDEEAEKFIALYWAKRDPNPTTAANEFRDEVSRRIAAADEQFKMRRQRGAESARGRLLVTLGPPSRFSQQRPQEADQTPSGVTAPGLSTGLNTSQQVTVTWTYEKSRFDPSLEIPELRVRILVDPESGFDQFQGAGQAEKAIAKVAEKSVVNPSGQIAAAGVNLIRPSAPPAATGPAPGAPAATGPPSAAAPAAAPAPAPTAALPAASRSVLESVLKEKRTDASFWGGSFRSIDGPPFFAMQLYVPAEKAAALPTGLKLGGIVVNESGAEVASFWEDASLLEMKTGPKADRTAERSLVLPPGSYRGSFGLFPPEGGEALVSSSAPFTIESRPGEFQVSPLILTNTLTPLTKRPAPTDPFVFGMEKPIRVEPKGNRMFTKDDGLWYFYTVSNPVVPEAAPAPAAAAPPAPAATPPPGVAPAPAPAPEGPKPRIMARISVLRDGRAAFAPFSGPAELQPLAPGYYASGSEIPLASFEPGYYTFILNVRDLNAPKDSPANKGIERKEEFIVLTAEGGLPLKAAKPAAPKPTPKKG